MANALKRVPFTAHAGAGEAVVAISGLDSQKGRVLRVELFRFRSSAREKLSASHFLKCKQCHVGGVREKFSRLKGAVGLCQRLNQLHASCGLAARGQCGHSALKVYSAENIKLEKRVGRLRAFLVARRLHFCHRHAVAIAVS